MTEPSPPDHLAQVCAVIVGFNSESVIDDLVDELPLEELRAVCLVDNSPDGGTADVVQRRLDSSLGPRLIVERSSINLGYGRAVNRACELLPPSRWLLVLNPDARISRQDLTELLRHMESNPRCAVCAPRLIGPEGPLSSAGRLATTRSEFRWLLPEVVRWICPDRRFPAAYATTGPVPVLEGACWLLDRSRLDEVGGFDSRFFLFFEEHDLARRFGRLDLTCDLVASAEALHLVGSSRAALPAQGRTLYAASALLYLAKWMPLRARLFVWATRLMIWARSKRNSKDQDETQAWKAALKRSRFDRWCRGRWVWPGPSWGFLYLLRALIPECVVEVGSMDGAEALRFRRASRTSDILAIEAHPGNFAAMETDRRLGDARIRILHAAVSDRVGEADLFVLPVSADRPETQGMSSLRRHLAQAGSVARVPATTLDAEVPDAGSVALWIDVEGATMDVLRGAPSTLSRTVAVHVEVELDVHWEGGSTADEVFAMLGSSGLVPVARSRRGSQFDVLFVRKSSVPAPRTAVARIVGVLGHLAYQTRFGRWLRLPLTWARDLQAFG